MKPLASTLLLAGVLLGAALLPTTARADHGWKRRDGYWLYYNTLDGGARQWYWFDPTPGRWMYWNDGRWTNYGPYRPPYVIIDNDAYGYLPSNYWRYPQFFPPPPNVLPTLDQARYGHYLKPGRGPGNGPKLLQGKPPGNPGRGLGNAKGGKPGKAKGGGHGSKK